MLQRILITIFAVLFYNLTYGQVFPSDSIKFIRYIDDTEEKVSIPLTRLYFLENTSFKSKFGWILQDDLKADSTKDFLLIDMNTNGVPPGEWSEYTPGSFLLAFQLDKGTKEILLDSINDKILLLNNYARKGVNNPINTTTGLLKFKTLTNGQVKIDGIITVKSTKPITKHEIIFKNATIPTTDYDSFAKIEIEKKEEQRRQERKMFDLTDRIAQTETNFYDSLFNYELYPSNKIKAQFKGKKSFEFKLDRSYIVEGTDISETPSENLIDLLGSNIYYPVLGESVVINLHHFFEGKKNIIDDETNYSLLIALPNIQQKEYLIDKKSDSKAKLAYWHYGPTGHIIESKSATGTLIIKSIDNQVVRGIMNLDFKSTDKKNFSINGEFQLPIIDKAEFSKLGQQIEKIINE